MLVFVHNNHTAGTTTRRILKSSFGARHCDAEPWHAPWTGPPVSGEDLRRLRKVYPKLTSIAGHRLTGHVDLEGPGNELRYFTVLRNPLKTVASRFQFHVEYRKKKGLVFEDWIQQDWLRDAQTTRIAGTPSVDEAIRVIKEKEILVGLTERFDESMVLLKALRAPDLDLRYERLNVAKRNTLAEELLADNRTRQMLVEANQADLELYEWAQNELLPTFWREYGPSLEDDVADYKATRPNEFNQRNIVSYRAKQYGVYRPLLRIYRRPRLGRLVQRALR